VNVVTLLEMAASGFGERVAVTSGGQSLTFAQLFAAAASAAAEVGASGASRLAILDVSSLAVPIGLYASAWAGVPFVPLNYRLTGAELEALAERIAPSLLVTGSERVGALAGLPGASVVAREEFLARHVVEKEVEPSFEVDPEAIAILLFTSGTTGVPKAAVLRHKHLVSYILGSVEFGGAGEDEAALVSVPPYHIAGMAAVLSNTYAGRRVVQLPSFGAESWLAAARSEGVTHAFLVPTMLARILDVLGDAPANLPNLRAISYGGGKMPLAVLERALRAFPTTDFTNAYGLTETSSTIAVLGPEDHRAAMASSDPAVRQRLVSVGRPLPSVEVEIRDPEGKALGAGEHGEVYVRGEQIAGEYLGKASTVEAEGWFPTRDGGFMDAEGYLFLEGRIDDVIVRGGENLSPGEIEEVLLEHPAVADCAVVGVPDEQWGEAVAAFVTLHPGASASAEELQEWVRARLRSSRMPARVEFRAQLPYTETGKLLRRQLRAELAAETPQPGARKA
jgi:acyl-CoA synthetase (AMP-forming)/AMP-acid ligase II